MAVASPFSPQSRAVIVSHDKTYVWKLALRLILFVLNIVAIGVLAGAITQTQSFVNAASDSYSSYGGDGLSYPAYTSAWYFIPLGLSCIWVIVYVWILFQRRKPPHPGFPVAFDLILSIAYLVLGGVLDTFAYYNTNGAFSDYNDYSSSSSSSSSYYTCYQNGQDSNAYLRENCQNGTDSIPSDLSYIYTFPNGTAITRQPGSTDYTCPGFDSCALSNDQSRLVADANAWAHRVAILGLVVAVFLSIAAIIHVILFIWACVDCHAYNRAATYDGRARVLATQMIEEMRARGELSNGTGQQQQMQKEPLLQQNTTYQEAGDGTTGAAMGSQSPSQPQTVHPAWRQNPGDIEGQYRDGPRLGNPLSAGPSYEPLSTAQASEKDGQAGSSTQRYA